MNDSNPDIMQEGISGASDIMKCTVLGWTENNKPLCCDDADDRAA